jgi:hypothetical protein
MDLPRTKTMVLQHLITKKPASSDAKEEESQKEVKETTLTILGALAPVDDEVTLTDLRITRAWCRGCNTDRIVDKIAIGRTDSAERLALVMCGARRVRVPKLFRDD